MNYTFNNSSIVSVNSGTIVLNVSGKTRTFADAKLVSAVDGEIVLDLPKAVISNGAYLTLHLICSNAYRTFIAKSIQDIVISYHITQCGAYGIKSTGNWNNTTVRYATPEEIQELDDQLAAEGKCWNPDTMQVEKLRWKPEYNEEYYFIDLFPLDTSIKTHRWADDNVDKGYYKTNNCFKTKEEAEAKLEKIKKLLLEV